MIEPKSDFVERICNEKWVLEAREQHSHSSFFWALLTQSTKGFSFVSIISNPVANKPRNSRVN